MGKKRPLGEKYLVQIHKGQKSFVLEMKNIVRWERKVSPPPVYHMIPP